MREETLTIKQLCERLIILEAKLDEVRGLSKRTVNSFRFYVIILGVLSFLGILLDLLLWQQTRIG